MRRSGACLRSLTQPQATAVTQQQTTFTLERPPRYVTAATFSAATPATSARLRPPFPKDRSRLPALRVALPYSSPALVLSPEMTDRYGLILCSTGFSNRSSARKTSASFAGSGLPSSGSTNSSRAIQVALRRRPARQNRRMEKAPGAHRRSCRTQGHPRRDPSRSFCRRKERRAPSLRQVVARLLTKRLRGTWSILTCS